MKRCPACTQRFSRDAGFCPFDGTKLEEAPVEPFVDPFIGTRVDARYDVLSLLGEGGMGRIYEVRHAALNRPFAMKVLRPELAQDSELAARFILEAKATASVKHPNVVQITDFGRLPDSVPYFVMELLVGHTLGEVIKAVGPIPAARAIRIVRKVAGALAAAHAAGVVHRDLKPDNVFLIGGSRDLRPPDDPDRGYALAMLGYGADVRVVDFGAAKIVGSRRVTRAGVVFGTPHYMAPEQASGQPVDHRADIYSLGVIMYETFTGRVPFEADTYMGVLTQHMFVLPVAPSRMPEVVDDLGPLEGIVLRCLEKKPEGRFALMDDLVQALDEVVIHAEGDAFGRRADRSSGRAVPLPSAPDSDPQGAPAAVDGRDSLPPATVHLLARHRRPAMVAGVAAALAAALAVAAAARGRRGEAQPAAPPGAMAGTAGVPPVNPPAPPPPAASPAAPRVADVTAPAASGPAPAGGHTGEDVGERATPGKPTGQHSRRADSAPRRLPSDMDDVGDPFAKH